MTVSTTASSAGPYACNGSTTEFPVNFPFLENDDLVVYLIDSTGASTTLTIDTHYTVTGAGGSSGTVTTVATYASGYTILIDRVVDLLQETDLENQATYYPEVLEDALDKLTMIAQQLYSGVSRSIKFPTSDMPITDPVLPSRDDRLGKFLQFDAVTGHPIVTTQTISVADYTGMAFETVAALRLSDPDSLVEGQMAVVAGYYAACDGGGGPLRVWQTSGAPYTDNGGSVIVPTGGDGSGAWVWEYSGAVNVKWFGASYAQEDSTEAIQEALDNHSDVVGESSEFYTVTTIIPASNQVIRDLNLLSKPSATTVSMRPVVRLGGFVDNVMQIVTNVKMINVNINGNRQNMSSVQVNLGEDGGMHGFRISQGATNIHLINCQANYCATAGLVLHGGQDAGGATYGIKDIHVENFVGNYNREHGMFGDSFDGFYMTNALFNFNGQDIEGGFPADHGNTAFTNGSFRFGCGFNLEEYVGFPFTYFKNFYASNVVCIGNATSVTVYAPSPPTEDVAIPAHNIFMKNVHFQAGDSGFSTRGLNLYANSPVGTNYSMDTVHISGYIQGFVEANNIRNLSYTEGFIAAIEWYKAVVNNGFECVVTVPGNRDVISIETLGSTVNTTIAGVGTLSTTISDSVKSQGKHTVQISYTVGNGLIAGGLMRWTIDLPSTIRASTVSHVYGVDSGGGVSVVDVNCFVVSPSQLGLIIKPIDDAISGIIYVDIY